MRSHALFVEKVLKHLAFKICSTVFNTNRSENAWLVQENLQVKGVVCTSTADRSE